MHSKLIALLAGLFFVPGVAAIAAAPDYPTKPIRLVVPFPPGSSYDILGRILGQQLAEAVAQPVVIDNRAGAAGVIGADTVAKSPPDGYTLLVGGNGALTIIPGLRARMPYDSLKDFAPVSMVAVIPVMLVVGPSVPVNSVKELIALARAKPRQLNYASSGVGSPPQLAAEMFKISTGTDIVNIVYKGVVPATIDLMSGRVQLMFSGITGLLPYVKAGKLKGLAVASATRSALMPGMPTVIESGLPDFTMETWAGVLVPSKTSTSIVTRLNRLIVKLVGTPDMKERLLELGAEPFTNTPQQFETYIKAEIAKYAKVIKFADIHDE